MKEPTYPRTAGEDEIAAVQYVILVEALASLLTVCGRASGVGTFLAGAAMILTPFGIACLGVARQPPGSRRGVFLAILSALAFLGYLALALEPQMSSTSGVAYVFLYLHHLLGCALTLALPVRRRRGHVRQTPSRVVWGRFPAAVPIASNRRPTG